MANMPDFGKQVGPLPLGAWVVLVGGGLAYTVYTRNRDVKASDGGVETPQQVDGMQVAGLGGMGAVGAYTPTGGVETPASATAQITSNTQWGQSAFSWLVAQGLDGSTVDAAIRSYLSGQPLSVQYNGIITQALGKFGMVPEPLPDAPSLPVVTQTPAPTPPPAPAPVTVPAPAPVFAPPAPAPAPPPARTYTVRPGDSLSRIAARYPEAWITWQSIYNLNRGVIGGNPNLIRPGQVLVIG